MARRFDIGETALTHDSKVVVVETDDEAVGLLAERPEATGLGLDASRKALMVARENADALGLSERASFRMGEVLMTGLRDIQSRYPVVGDVRGLGLMVGAEFTEADGSPATALVKAVNQMFAAAATRIVKHDMVRAELEARCIGMQDLIDALESRDREGDPDELQDLLKDAREAAGPASPESAGPEYLPAGPAPL